VNALLQPLAGQAIARWDAGVAIVASEFRGSLDRVQAWIDERHEGVGGALVGLYDAVAGLPDWVIVEYDRAERAFGDGVCELLTEISRDVNAVTAAAQAVIEGARTRIDALFAGLPENLRAWAEGERARFQGQLNGLSQRVTEAQTSFVRDVSQRAVTAVTEVQAEVERVRSEARGVIGRVADAIEAFLEDPIRVIIDGLLSLAGIPPPAFWALVERIRQVISDIADDPERFINNLVEALRLGFEGFFERFGQHVVNGFWEWLFSGLGSVGVRMPPDTSLRSLVTFALQVMGITWPRIREVLVRHIGEDNVELIERAWEIISTLIEQGPEGIFNMIRDRLDPQRILNEILTAAVDYLIEALIRQVTIRVVALLNPVGAIVQAIELIYKVLKWVFQNAARIFRLIETVVNGIADILAGNLGAMAAAVERALASLVPIVIDFLAGLLGLGDLPDRIADVIRRLQAWVLGIVDTVIGFLVTQARALLAAIGLGGEEDEEPEEGAEDTELGTEVRFSADGESHRHWIDVSGGEAVLMVASMPQPVADKLADWRTRAPDHFGEDTASRDEALQLCDSAEALLNEADAESDALAQAYEDAARIAAENEEPELPSDDPVERKQRALATILERLYEKFGEKPDPEVMFATQLEPVHTAARPPIVTALKALDPLPTAWAAARSGALGKPSVAAMQERPLLQSHPFGETFAHNWAAGAALTGMNTAFAGWLTLPESQERRRLNSVWKNLGKHGGTEGDAAVTEAGAKWYLINYKAQLHEQATPFDQAPTPLTLTQETIWRATQAPTAEARITSTFEQRVRMGMGAPPGPELPDYIRKRIWELLVTSKLNPPRAAGADVHIEFDATSAARITDYLTQEIAIPDHEPAMRETLQWWQEYILAPEFHHAWPQWLGGAAEQTRIIIPRALHNFDGISTDGQNFPGGFHQVFNDLFRAAGFPVPVNDGDRWELYVSTNPAARARVAVLLAQAYAIVFQPFAKAGQEALKRYVDEAKMTYPGPGQAAQ
jgi:hypothetical protein